MPDQPAADPANPWLARPDVSGADYDAPYAARAAAGEDVHGEANAVLALRPGRPLSVLDAGCGTGRIAIELALRGADVVGVDLDPRMLERARTVAPGLDWRQADLAGLDLGRAFDVVLLAGNVMLFVTPGSEARVVAAMARHLRPGGLLVAGFQLGRTAYGLADYDAAAAAAGLALAARWSTWDGAPWTPASDYAVSVHRAGG
ncbi:MAG TPA: class I SAM-dependent methyltransferase [Herpetosiphonaceae bacterium]|nr:class I SAM-dependent methyltransferase [Herpetosiphonaceae bacterium]